MLVDLGHTGIAASSAKRALDILRQQDSVDVVITDFAMPNMSGLELVEAIKKEWPELPVIIATGYAEKGQEAESNLPTLSKPFTEVELVKELDLIAPRSCKDGRVLKFRGAAPRI
jgi:CheY-like chemotaxis protein